MTSNTERNATERLENATKRTKEMTEKEFHSNCISFSDLFWGEKCIIYLWQKNDLDLYKKDFDRVAESIQQGKTPVFCEMRSAKTNLVESIPYNFLCGVFWIFSTILLNRLNVNEVIKIALVLIVNNFCGAASNYVFIILKHHLRIKLCKRLNIEPNERNIVVMESLEYQSVWFWKRYRKTFHIFFICHNSGSERLLKFFISII